MKNILVLTLLSGMVVSINANAGCSPDNEAYTHVRRPCADCYAFTFSRSCDKRDYTCTTHYTYVVVETDKGDIDLPMHTLGSSWFTEEYRFKAKAKSYYIQYRDRETKQYCKTPVKSLERT